MRITRLCERGETDGRIGFSRSSVDSATQPRVCLSSCRLCSLGNYGFSLSLLHLLLPLLLPLLLHQKSLPLHIQQLMLTIMQVWRFAGVEATGMVDTIIRSCFVSQDTRVHRAGIHALIAIIRSCWHSGIQQTHHYEATEKSRSILSSVMSEDSVARSSSKCH